MPITRTNPLPTGAIGLLGIFLLAFAAPSLAARLYLLPTDSLREELRGNAPLSENSLSKLETANLRVMSWFPRAELEGDLALISSARGQREKQPQTKRAFFLQAKDRQEIALRLSPVDPLGWFRLAYLYMALDGRPTKRSAAAWTQSMSVAPYEPSMMIPRLQMGLAHGALLSDEGRAYIPPLIRGSSVFDADALARLAKAGAFTALVEEALQTDPAALAYFRKRLLD